MNKSLSLMLSLLSLALIGCNEQKPDVILVIIDALRADHLGCYGYDRETSPALNINEETTEMLEDLGYF